MRFFLYARKSTDEDDRQLLSIDAQLREVRELAAREKVAIVREFVESRTAKQPGRPIFNEMLDAIESGEADGILSWHPDRLARNSVDGGRIIYLLDIGKLDSLKFPNFWFENTPQGKFMLNIAFGQSKYYVDNLSENIRRGFREKLARGEFPGRPPVGYLNHPRLRTIVVDDEKAPLIRRLFETYAEGTHSYQNLSDLARDWGLRNHVGNPVRLNKIPEILAHPFYIGQFVVKGEIHQGTHEPIIPKKLFDRVQEVMKRRGWKVTRQPEDPFAFLGLVQCVECGGAITAERQKGHHYYRCTKKVGPCGQGRYSREEILAEQMRDTLRGISISDDWTATMLEQVEKDRAGAFRNSSATVAEKKERLAAVQAKLSRLLNAMLEGVVSRDEYTTAKQSLIAEKTSLEADLAEVQAQGNVWLEPLAEYIRRANQAEKALFSDRLEDLRDFHRKIGSNLFLSDPKRKADARSASALGAPVSNPPSPGLRRASPRKSSAERRRGGCAARALLRQDFGGQAPARNPSLSCVPPAKSGFLAFPASPSSVAALSPKSSAKVRARPAPVLLVKFPEPWGLWATMPKSSGWWTYYRVARTYFIEKMAKKAAS